jgi:hypothetical protein
VLKTIEGETATYVPYLRELDVLTACSEMWLTQTAYSYGIPDASHSPFVSS